MVLLVLIEYNDIMVIIINILIEKIKKFYKIIIGIDDIVIIIKSKFKFEIMIGREK
jgi:hypothetical protein